VLFACHEARITLKGRIIMSILPLHQFDVTSPPNQLVSMEGKRILVIDDDQVVRAVLDEALTQQGFAVELAVGPAEARMKFKHSEFDLILLDIVFPGNGESGFDIINEIKSRMENSPVVLITAHPNTESAVAALRLNAFDYLTKPIGYQDLCLVVKRALQHKSLLDNKNRVEEENERYRKTLEQRVHEQTSEIQANEKRLRAIFDHMRDIYYYTDMEGNITDVSPSCFVHTGYTLGELLGTNVLKFYANPSRRDKLLRLLRKNGAVNVNRTARRISRHGKAFPPPTGKPWMGTHHGRLIKWMRSRSAYPMLSNRIWTMLCGLQFLMKAYKPLLSFR